MTDDHHTPEGADGLREQLAEVLGAYDEEVLDYIMDKVAAEVAAEVHASERRLLLRLKAQSEDWEGDGGWLPAAVPVSAIDAELEKLGRGEK